MKKEEKMEGLRLAEKLLGLSNFKLKIVCRQAKEKYPRMESYDVRNNVTMKEALWSLGYEELREILNDIE